MYGNGSLCLVCYLVNDELFVIVEYFYCSSVSPPVPVSQVVDGGGEERMFALSWHPWYTGGRGGTHSNTEISAIPAARTVLGHNLLL